jgi:hypothetical protein
MRAHQEYNSDVMAHEAGAVADALVSTRNRFLNRAAWRAA